MPASSNTWITPTWAKPRAAPPPKAKPIRGGRFTAGGAGWLDASTTMGAPPGDAGGADAHAAKNKYRQLASPITFCQEENRKTRREREKGWKTTRRRYRSVSVWACVPLPMDPLLDADGGMCYVLRPLPNASITRFVSSFFVLKRK